MLDARYKLILFAAACFAVPVLIALIVLVVLSFSDSVTNIAIPLMTLTATFFAAYAAWQSAKSTRDHNKLIASISLSAAGVDIISTLNDAYVFFCYEALMYPDIALRTDEPDKRLEVLIQRMFHIEPQMVRFGAAGIEVKHSICRARMALVSIKRRMFSQWKETFGVAYIINDDNSISRDEAYHYAIGQELKQHIQMLEQHIDVTNI